MIPVSRDSLTRWTPPTLANIPAPPVFIFRATTWALRRRYQELCDLNNLTFPGDALLNGELRNSLRKLWTPENYEREIAQVEEALLKQEQGILAGEQLTDFLQLQERVAASSEPYSRLLAQRASFMRYSPYCGLALMLAGWENLETPFEREGGEIPFEVLEDLEREVVLAEEEALQAKVKGVTIPGLAWLALCNELWRTLDLNGLQRKNSSPGLQSAGTPDGSSPAGPVTVDGKPSETNPAANSSASGPSPAQSPNPKARKKQR